MRIVASKVLSILKDAGVDIETSANLRSWTLIGLAEYLNMIKYTYVHSIVVKERKRVLPSNTSPQAYLARDAIPEEAIEVSASEVMVNGLFKLPNGQK